MSARPDVPRLAEEDLDLLISRSLDGDLSPEEEQQLERLVALDPAAARRKAELSALVADVKALPEPATPFALATRVNSNLSERAGRPGSLGGRVGFFPAPGFAKAALVVLAIVGAAIAVLRPAPRRLAEGPVDVLLYSPQRPAAPASQIAEAKPDSIAKELRKEKAFAPQADERRNEAPAGETSRSRSSEKKTAVKLEQAAGNAPAASDASALVADSAARQNADREDGAATGTVREEAPAKVTSAGALAPVAAAPAAAPAPALASGAPGRDGFARIPGGWTVSVRGDAVRRWSLQRAPDNPPPAHGTAVYRVTLDASGRVSALSRVGAAAPDPRLDAFVRGMVFEPIASRAEAQARIAAKDAARPPASDFEIELTPR